MPGPMVISREVDAPAEVVWQVMTDIENAAETVSGIESVERLDESSEFEVGTRWRETRVMFGRTATEEMTVTEVDPGRSYTTQAQHGKARYTSVLSVDPAGAETSVLSMHFGAEVSGVLNKTLGAVVGRLLEGSTRKLMRQDLADIAAAAELRA